MGLPVLLLSLWGCTRDNTVTNPPSSDWLNASFVCTPFTRYPKAEPEAIALYDKALALSRGEPPIDQVNITALYEQAAERGYWAAMHNTAIRYYQGNGVMEDEQRALYWFKALEKLAIPEAYYGMFLVHYKGIGVKKDRNKALEYVHKGAQLGDPDALVSVAKSLYPEGKFQQAYIALECAVQQGHKQAAWELASNYETDKDYDKAYHAYRNGAKLGCGSCVRALAYAYAHQNKYPTFGLNKDEPRASCLFKLAKTLRDKPELRFPDLDERCPATVAQPKHRD